ncbi:uncharacterized protein C8Q71DRAFT_679292, partial [Rhodofomes roseus]
GNKLTEADMNLLRAWTLKVEERLTDKAFDRFRFAFHNSDLPSIKAAKTRVAFLSGFTPEIYDCCVNSCVCYTGPYADCRQCPHCNEDRFDRSGRPRKHFRYLPLIPRLRTAAANVSYATKMQYRTKHDQSYTPGITTDIFGGTHYRHLKGKQVEIDDRPIPSWFFNDPRDIALGLSTDGFGPHKSRTKT